MSKNLSDIVGKNYEEFWVSDKRYTVIKGGRASKKSYTVGLWLIHNIMKHKDTNALVVRRFFNTNKDSTFAQLLTAINRLGVEQYWSATTVPLELTYTPTGQKILFRGLDQGSKVTSITVSTGKLAWCWFEEAYEFENENDFDMVDLSFRGALPNNVKYRLILTFNPWSDTTWLKKRFFDTPDKDVLALTTNYTHNEFLTDDDIYLFEKMKQLHPKRYKVEGLGEWGISSGLVYENWEVQEFDRFKLAKNPEYIPVFGLDFGYVNSKTAFVGALVNKKTATIYIFDEYYQQGMLNNQIADMITNKGYSKELIVADCAEPKSLAELKAQGIYRIIPSVKGRDSINNGIQYIQQYKIIVHPTCAYTIKELESYRWKTKDGESLNEVVKENDHIMDALRYAIQIVRKPMVVKSDIKKLLDL